MENSSAHLQDPHPAFGHLPHTGEGCFDQNFYTLLPWGEGPRRKDEGLTPRKVTQKIHNFSKDNKWDKPS
jgi:hypothetical protein